MVWNLQGIDPGLARREFLAMAKDSGLIDINLTRASVLNIFIYVQRKHIFLLGSTKKITIKSGLTSDIKASFVARL